jgi:hypothetical protein
MRASKPLRQSLAERNARQPSLRDMRKEGFAPLPISIFGDVMQTERDSALQGDHTRTDQKGFANAVAGLLVSAPSGA